MSTGSDSDPLSHFFSNVFSIESQIWQFSFQEKKLSENAKTEIESFQKLDRFLEKKNNFLVKNQRVAIQQKRFVKQSREN